MKTVLLLLLLLLCCVGDVVSMAEGHEQYLATVHHAPEGYMSARKRSINSEQFVGNLVFNNTINNNGEVTISLCDITKDLFGDRTKYKLFNFDKSGGVDPFVQAKLSASVDLNINIDGCLQFFFDPCCETVGVRFLLDDPVVLNANAAVDVTLKAFNALGISAGSDDIKIDPLSDIKLGSSPIVGSWKLPSILDPFVSTSMSNERMCANLGLPGGIAALKFCVELKNLTSSIYTVNVCPRVTVYLGPQKLFDVSYTKLVPGSVGAPPECLALSFLPVCSHAGQSVAPDIMQLFRSIDVNNDFKIALDEIIKSKALLGVYNTKDTNSIAFSQLDGNSDGEVNFQEFQTYTTTQSQNFQTAPYVEDTTTYSGGDVALAVIMTMLATALVVGIVIVVVAQYKGIIKIAKLEKIIPSNRN